MKNSFKIAKKLLFRNKMTKINIIFITLMMLLMIFLFTYKETIKNYLNKDIYDRIFNNYLAFKVRNDDKDWTKEEVDAMQEEIRKIPHVLFTTYQYAFASFLQVPQFKNDKIYGNMIGYVASNETLPKIVSGTNFPDDKGNYLVCPENFYPTFVETLNKKLTKDDKVDLTSYLNKEITIHFSTYKSVPKTLDFKLVGLYKNSDYTYDEYTCFINRSSMINVGKTLYEGEYDPIRHIDAIDEQTNIFYIIDDYKNEPYVTKKLEDLGYIVEDGYDFSLDNYYKLITVLNIFIILVIVCILIIEIILFRKIKIENENNFNLLHVLGFKKKDIFKVFMFSNLIQIFISLIISVLILFIGLGILKYIINIYPFIFAKHRICVNYYSILIVVVITIISSLINYFSIKNKWRII